MNKKIMYLLILLVYGFVGTLLAMKLMVGSKSGIIIMLICCLALWFLTIWICEKDNFLIKTSKKAKAMFNYFDVEAVKELLSKEKTKGDRFEMFRSDDSVQKITVLSIKILNNDAIKTLDDDKRIRTLGTLLEIIEEKVEDKYGIIYNIKDDVITVLFNTIYVIDEPELEAVKAALEINLELMQARKESIYLSQVKLDYAVTNEEMDFFIREKRVLVNGDFKLANELVNITGEDSIFIPENIYKKYMNAFDYDYLGKFYFPFGDVKVYKVIKIINEREESDNTYKKSKIVLKKGSENKLKKYAKEKESEMMKKRDGMLRNM